MAVQIQIDLAQSSPGNDATEGYFYRMEEPTSLIHSVDLQISMIINLSSVEVNRNQSPQRHPRAVRLVCQNKAGHILGESGYWKMSRTQRGEFPDKINTDRNMRVKNRATVGIFALKNGASRGRHAQLGFWFSQALCLSNLISSKIT